MAATDALGPQFAGHMVSRDPHAPGRNRFPTPGSKTMRISGGRGLPRPLAKHPHRNHAGPRGHRAVKSSSPAK